MMMSMLAYSYFEHCEGSRRATQALGHLEGTCALGHSGGTRVLGHLGTLGTWELEASYLVDS